MGCVSRSRAAGAPRLGKDCHTHINVFFGPDRLRHPSTLDGMVWYGMGCDLAGWDCQDEMRWDEFIVRTAAVPQERHGWERAGTPRHMCAPALASCGTLPH